MVSTPIGNLEDITRRAIRVLGEVDKIACEDTRVTGKLLKTLGVETPLIRHERHNEAASTQGIVQLLESGSTVALVSDAGTPSVSDPGERLVREVVNHGLAVVPIPGASALLAALVGSGLPATPFSFHGFLPPKTSQRRGLLGGLDPGTHLFFCPARDLGRLVQELLEVRETCDVAIARELTKRHETWYRGRPASIALSPSDLRGEAVVVIHIADATGDAIDDQAITDALRPLLDRGERPSEAARAVASQLGVSRRRVYQLAMDL